MGNIPLMLDCAFCIISSLQIDPQNVIGHKSFCLVIFTPQRRVQIMKHFSFLKWPVLRSSDRLFRAFCIAVSQAAMCELVESVVICRACRMGMIHFLLYFHEVILKNIPRACLSSDYQHSCYMSICYNGVLRHIGYSVISGLKTWIIRSFILHSACNKPACLFICGLFNDTVASLGCDMYPYTMANEQLNWRGFGRKRPWYNFR